MRIGLLSQTGNIVTATGSSNGAAGKSLSIIMGDGNATGPAAGGTLTLKGGAGTTTGAGGSIQLQPGTSASGSAGIVQILPTKASAGGTTALQFMGINGTGYVGFKAPDAITTNVVWQLPAADGTSGQVLQTNGSGVTTWASPSVPNVFVNIAGNSGTAVADAAADTLTFTGTAGIQTVASDNSNNDVLTISLTRAGLSVKASPASADQFLMFDSAASNAPVYATASTVAAAIGAVTTSRIVRGTFTNASLTSGSVALTHGLNNQFVLVQIYDENNQVVQPDNITATSATVSTVDLTSFGTISGTWNYIIFG